MWKPATSMPSFATMSKMRLRVTDRLVLVVVDVEMQIGPLQRHHVMAGGVGPVDHALALALDGEGHQPGRMPEGVDRADAGHDLVARLDHGALCPSGTTIFT